jgi:hypothetical protein
MKIATHAIEKENAQNVFQNIILEIFVFQHVIIAQDKNAT